MARTILTSVHGRRLGLARLSSAQTGSNHGELEQLTGDNLIGVEPTVTTAPTTSRNLKPYGLSYMVASSAGSSQVYTLDPPIPGVNVTIKNSTDATAYVKTANTEVIHSTVGSTQHVISFPAAGASINLQGLTTAIWITAAATAGGIGLTNTT